MTNQLNWRDLAAQHFPLSPILDEKDEQLRSTFRTPTIAGWPTAEVLPLYISAEVFAFLTSMEIASVKRYYMKCKLKGKRIGNRVFIASSELLLADELEAVKRNSDE
jgi:hypothetical protein